MSGKPTLVLVSGLGGDARLFRPQQSLPARLIALDWIEPRPGETLASYGRRLAEGVDAAAPYFLGGISMGAMLALEMSRWLRPEAVLMIAGARSGREIRPVFRILGRMAGGMPLWGAMPKAVSRPLGRFVARHLLPSVRQLRPEDRQLCAEMGRDCSPAFVRWGCRAVTTWPGVQKCTVPVYHVHGETDRVIPVRRVRPDHVVRGGGHLINMTHTEEVNAYLAEKIAAHTL